LRRTEEDIKRIALNKEGVLRICTQSYTAYRWLPSIVKVFTKRFPNVDLQVSREETSRSIRSLVDRKYDVAIVPGEIRERRVTLEPLFKDRLVVIMHPKHPLAGKRPVEAEDFADQHLFMYADRLEEYTYYNSVLLPAGITPRRVSQMQLTEGIIDMVKAGLGIAVLVDWVVALELKRRTIKALPLTPKGFVRQWSAATLRYATRSDYLERFTRLLANRRMPATRDARTGS